jgi:uncharacterized protein (TIGR00251 family)
LPTAYRNRILRPETASGEIHFTTITMSLPSFVRIQPDGILLSVKLQPRASANEIGEPTGDELRIKVTAAPVDSAANEVLLRLLAEYFGCPRNRVELLRGGKSRHKVVKVYGLSTEALLAKLAHLSAE